MSDPTKTDDTATLMAKLAALETKLSDKKDADPAALAREIARNPVAAFQKYGINKDHVTQVLVADALGDQAPPALRTAAALGPTVAAQSELAAEMAALRQRLDAAEKASASRIAMESTKTHAADKSKYPHLARALANDPDLIQAEIERTGASAQDAAAKVEAQLARAAKAMGYVPADGKKSDDTAREDDPGATTSRKVTAHEGGNPPPVNRGSAKAGWSEEDRDTLRDNIVRKWERGEYDSPGHPYRQ